MTISEIEARLAEIERKIADPATPAREKMALGDEAGRLRSQLNELTSDEAEDAFVDWVLSTYGWLSNEYQIAVGPVGDWWNNDVYREWEGAGYPTREEAEAAPPTYDEIVADESLSLEEKHNLIKESFPNRIMDWLSSPEGSSYLTNFAVQDPNTGVYTLPDGTQVQYDPNTGMMIEPTPEMEIVQTFTDSDGNIHGYELSDGTYVMQDRVSPTTLEQIQGWIDNYEANKTSPPIPDPTAYPTEPNTEGFEWTWDGNQWVETPVEPDITIPPGYTIDEETGFLRDAEGNLYVQDPNTGQLTPVTPEMEKDMPPFPTEPPPPGYAWQYDPNTNTYIPVYTGEEEPYEMPPYPTETPPPGYIWDYNPSTGQWELTPGQLPGQEGITPVQQAQLDLEERALQLQQQGMLADQAWRQAQLEQQQRETEAQMLTQPASWLEYAALTGKQAAVQPWMLPLEAEQYPEFGLQAGAPLYGWGPEWEEYYGGQAGAPTPPGGVTGQPQIPGAIPPAGGRPPRGGQGAPGGIPGEGWEPTGGAGYQQTGGLDYDAEQRRIIKAKQEEILNELVIGRTGSGGYMSPEWFSMFTMEEKNALLQESIGLAHQWYLEEYGEAYPVYPGGPPGVVGGELPPRAYPTPPEPGDPDYIPPTPGEPGFGASSLVSPGVGAVRQATSWNQPLRTATQRAAPLALGTQGTAIQPTGQNLSAGLAPVTSGEERFPTNAQYAASRGLVGGTTGGQIPSYYDPKLLEKLLEPARQYQARMGPTALQQMYGYEQARTGALPMETNWRLWSHSPPAGQHPGLRYRR